MRNLLILWSIPNSDEDYKKYETIINVFKVKFKNINSPIDTKNFYWTDSERFDRAINMVKGANLIIWELSLPSTWQWLELWIAYTLNKSIIILAKEWSNISWLIKGNPNLKEIIYYSDLVNLEKKLWKI